MLICSRILRIPSTLVHSASIRLLPGISGTVIIVSICFLGIPGDLLADLGAVSEPVARMMAEGALEASNAHISVAITGVAGPHGGTSLKQVGTVHIATARTNHGLMHRQEFFQYETRTEIQLAAVQVALQALRDRMT